MRVLLDEGVPEALAQSLPGHEVHTVGQLGAKSTKNGKLLALAASKGFEAFITADKAMESQQSLDRCPFRILLLSTSHWPVLRTRTAAVADALLDAIPGQVVLVDCGIFQRRRRYWNPR